jgi:biopolymer transport protein ExbD
MALRSLTDDEPGMNMTPMIDVVFLLIIFFMVGTKFYELEREFDVQVPEVSQANPLTSAPEEIIVSVQRDGKVFLGEEPTTLVQLTERLADARARYADQAVLVRGDGATAYQRVADVLAACTQAGIGHLNLGVRQRPEESP